MDFFTTFDRNGPINPTWFRVVIRFESDNVFALDELRKMLKGENGLIDFNNFILRPDNMVHCLLDDEYEQLDVEKRKEYDAAAKENRIGDGWERCNWGCDINADDAKWTCESTFKFDVTGGIPKPILSKLAETVAKLGIEFNGFVVPNKFGHNSARFMSNDGKIEYRILENSHKFICDEWDIPTEEWDYFLEQRKNEIPSLIRRPLNLKMTLDVSC